MNRSVIWFIALVVVLGGVTGGYVWYRQQDPAPSGDGLATTTPTTTPSTTAEDDDETNSPVVIGFVGPLSGDMGPTGRYLQQVITQAVAVVNADGGLQFQPDPRVPKRPLEVVFEDGQCNKDVAATAAQKLITEKKVRVIIGGICNAEVLGMATVVEAAGVILISPTADGPEITTAGNWVFRTTPAQTTVAEALADAAIARKLPRVAIVSENTSIGQSVARAVSQRVQQRGGQVAAQVYYQSNGSDLATAWQAVAAAQPQAVIVVPGSTTGAHDIFDYLNHSPWRVPILTMPLVMDAAVTTGNEAVLAEAWVAQPDFNAQAPALIGLTATITDPLPAGMPLYWVASTYDTVQILAEIISDAHYVAVGIQNDLSTIRKHKGLISIDSMTDDGDPIVPMVYRVYRNNEWVPVKP